jgi:zinc protease
LHRPSGSATPYRRPVIGSIEDLDAATLDDVRRFHATYYRPDNAALIVAGDFDLAQAQAWVDRYFGPLSRPDTPVPRVTEREPRRERAERVALQAPRVPLPAVALMWQAPPAGHADAAALRVASALLSGGESARLNETLVYRDRIAQSAGFVADLLADAGMLAAWAISAGAEPGSRRAGELPAGILARLEQALRRELERLARGPISAAELDKVRTGLVTQALSERQTPGGRAMAVGWAVIQQGDARAADRQLAQLQAVQAGDVQRVLRRYVGQGHAVTLTYTQGPAAAATSSQGGH